jgi:hypothetical protein
MRKEEGSLIDEWQMERVKAMIEVVTKFYWAS